MFRFVPLIALAMLAAFCCPSARAEILWHDDGARLVHNTGTGFDILGGAVKRDDAANDVLYFKVHINPISDTASEPYFAGFQLFNGDSARLALGNAKEAWAWSAFDTAGIGPSNIVVGEFNLNSSHPEPSRLGIFLPYELPRHDVERTIIFKVQFVPGDDDLVTVWLNPNLTLGATEKNQPASLATKFKADAAFNQIRLRHEGGGNGWIFSDMAVATSFNDFVVVRFWQTWWFITLAAFSVLVAVGTTVRVMEKKKYLRRLNLAKHERAVEQERTRIARDLHDDLGSSLTRISLLSGLLQTDRNNPDQVAAHASKLSQSAAQTVRALEEIVWAVRPGSDTLQSLIEYITHFANELFDGHQTRCRLDLPHDLPALALPPDVRHNIFLIIKEALTNALKHSAAKEVRIAAKAIGSTIEFVVADDGKGFAPSDTTTTAGKRNGLGNMRQRAETIGGRLVLQSAPGSGTTVRLTVNLAGGKHRRPA